MPDQIGWTSMKDGKIFNKPEPLYRRETPEGSVCPKCGAARKPKWTGFECGSEEHQFGMPYVQSLGCRIAELTRDLTAARDENERLVEQRASLAVVVRGLEQQLAHRDREIEWEKQRHKSVCDSIRGVRHSWFCESQLASGKCNCGMQLTDRDREIHGLRDLLADCPQDDSYNIVAYRRRIDAALQQIAARRQEQEPQEGPER